MKMNLVFGADLHIAMKRKLVQLYVFHSFVSSSCSNDCSLLHNDLFFLIPEAKYFLSTLTGFTKNPIPQHWRGSNYGSGSSYNHVSQGI